MPLNLETALLVHCCHATWQTVVKLSMSLNCPPHSDYSHSCDTVSAIVSVLILE